MDFLDSIATSPYKLTFSCGSAAEDGKLPPRSCTFYIAHNDTPQSIDLSTRVQSFAVTLTEQNTTLRNDKYPCARWSLKETELTETYPG